MQQSQKKAGIMKQINGNNVRNIKLTIAYDGTRYRGWQRLGDSDKTIQGKIEAVLTRCCGEKIEINGSGRTDAGAHAYAQVANFKTRSEISCHDLLEFAHTYLPNDIVIFAAEEVPEKFHARLHAKSKRYVYRIDNGHYPDVFTRNYAWHVAEKLNIEDMRTAALSFLGKHDFTSFTSDKAKNKSIRTIYVAEIQQTEDGVEIIFEGDGFLYNMVRIMVGTLLEIGWGERYPNCIDAMFEAKDRQCAGQTAPAHGLFLESVGY